MLDKKTPAEIEILREGGKILGNILKNLGTELKIGSTGLELDKLAEKMIIEAGAFPAFKNYHGFPNALCVSVNDTVVHGIPNNRPFVEGDIIGLDLGIKYKDLYTDSAITVGVGRISSEAQQLLFVTRKALDVGIAQLKVGNHVSDIGVAIEEFIKPYGYGIVRDLTGHGVGRYIHENPMVPNYDPGMKTEKMFPGLVIAIEPMIIMGGDYRVGTADNKWDVLAYDGSLTAHFEHSVAITEDGYIILTQ